ncbi:MAG: hypothetical protein ACUVQ3_09330 [bacterium]
MKKNIIIFALFILGINLKAEETIIGMPSQANTYHIHKSYDGHYYYIGYETNRPDIKTGVYNPNYLWYRGALNISLSPIPPDHVKIEYARIRFNINEIMNTPIPFRCTNLTIMLPPPSALSLWTNIRTSNIIINANITSSGWTSWFEIDPTTIPYSQGYLRLGFYMFNDTATSVVKYL